MALSLYSWLFSPALLSLVAILLIGNYLWIIVYRLYFHPLSKYPGPLLGKISNLYAGYHAWKGDLHVDMWRCHEQYGEFVRYAPNGLLVNTVQGLRDIYTHGKNFKKSAKYNAMVHGAPNTLTAIDKVKHGRKRRIISQGFSDAALKEYEVVILDKIEQLTIILSSDEQGHRITGPTWSVPRDMSRLNDWFTFDVMSSIIFGVHRSSLQNSQYRFVPEVIEKSNIRVSALIEAPELRWFRIDKLLFPESLRARNRLIKFIQVMLEDGIQAAASKSTKSVFNLLTDARDPHTGESLKRRELQGESATLIVAGTDTTSTALAACLFYLTHNRTAYERVASEVRTAFSSPEGIRMGALSSQCPFLRACIDESMRLSPSAAGALWREAGSGGATVDGKFIPPGADIATCIYSIHHNPLYYPKPFDFVPQRWISDEAKEVGSQIQLAQGAFNPFSIGPRSCIGKGLAYVEIHLMLARLLWEFDFRLADGDFGRVGEGNPNSEYGRHRVDEFQMNDHITCAKQGPFIQFRPRVHS